MKILVLCTGNSCRSQIAEAYLKQLLREDAMVLSAGLNPQGVNPYAVKIMQEIGIDISQNSSNNLNEYLEIEFDYVLTVCSHADSLCPMFPGNAQKVHIPFDDPADAKGSDEEILGEFRRVRDEIKTKLAAWVKTF